MSRKEAERYFQNLCDRSNLGSRLIKWFEIASTLMFLTITAQGKIDSSSIIPCRFLSPVG
jgi:hypothetical protein